MHLIATINEDLKCKAKWCYDDDRWTATLKAALTDGSMAMIIYRLMQWSRRWKLFPLELFFNKANAVLCNCIIGRGADFGRGFVLVHSTGIVINGAVRGGDYIYLEHQVTIGAERRQAPVLGNRIFVGAGAKIIGPVSVGSGSRIGANAVVLKDVPEHATMVGIPAEVVRRRAPQGETADICPDKATSEDSVVDGVS